ncbi:hypothetical protein Pan14r_46060 [Crateriforma conspicua]|uniref:Uncharacterized protein n=2 Tax=Crateriforma conspicua TaxID=2527996 RepID=A0A5C5YBI2_9PLAN|nr:hypothetical protein Pan14r_46060 [Crateriforma conspicua]
MGGNPDRQFSMPADWIERCITAAGVNKTFTRIVKQAGLIEWPRLMQNSQASRETEPIAMFPNLDVASWLGNSAPIAMQHYSMTI